MGKASLVWNFFLKDTKESAKCNFCHKSLKTTDGTTSALRRHLKKHPSEINKLTLAEKERDTAPPPQKKSRLDSHSHSSSCDQCPKSFTQDGHFKSHRHLHEETLYII